MVELLENVRGKDCFVLQSTALPANDSLMEVLLMVDALKRASAARVRRRSRITGTPPGPATALGGAWRSAQGGGEHAAGGRGRPRADDGSARRPDTGVFDVPVDNVYAAPVLLGDVWKHQYETSGGIADVGGVRAARARWRSAWSPTSRSSDSGAPAERSEVMNVIGDVKGRN